MTNEQQRFEILLEQIRSQLQIVAEGHSLLDQKIERMAEKFERRFEEVETSMRLGFKKVYERLDKIETRLGEVEIRLDKIETKLGEVEI